jgi:hypothetical protein
VCVVVRGCWTERLVAEDDPIPSKGRCGRLTDEVPQEEFESPESSGLLAGFAVWLE